MRRWLLPEHIEDVLPAEARTIERLRRAILDLFEAHGYELVAPPLLESLESLLSGTGRDLDLATFKLTDRLSGRLMGVRADHTPQVARIDAHLLNRQGVARLCYCGSVLHTVPAGMTKMREPIQIGAELYGHGGLEADLAELGGFNYKSGFAFAAFPPGSPDAMARGGRYDEVGAPFGRGRPATGFTMDLRQLAALAPKPPQRRAILAPPDADPALAAAIGRLRAAGEIVIVDLPGHDAARDEAGCDRKLIKKDGQWLAT